MTTLIQNPKAKFNYEILESIDAGIELLGLEVKSLKKKQGSLEGAYIIVRGNEVYLIGSQVPPYQFNNTSQDYDPLRIRKLLLTKKEIKNLLNRDKTNGLTMIPLSIYTKGRYIKIKIAIVKGKKKYDKRETIKKRENDRNIRRILKQQN